MGDVVRFPSALTEREERVEALCRAVARGKAVRRLLEAEELDGTVELRVGDVCLHLDPAEALEYSRQIARAAAEAIESRKGAR